MKSVRSAAIALSALMFVVAGAPARAAEAPKALSPWDAQLYAAAFDAVKRGDFASAEQNTARVSDKSLLGFVEFQKLFHPTAYTATYAELMAWLDKYADLPGAQRVRALAAKRKPTETSIDGVAPTTVTPAGQRTWESIDAVLNAVQTGERFEPLTPKAAREALNAGDLTNARKLATETGDWWVAGLAAWRQRDYEEAFRRFEMIALDVTEDPWVRSGGAYWAARSAVARGTPQDAPELLRVAAQFPHTFYGMIAERQLGLEPALRTGPQPYLAQAAQPVVMKTAAAGGDLATPALQQLIKTNPRAKRAVALAQLGQTMDAGLELRAGMAAARTEPERADWTALAMALNDQLSASRTRDVVDARDYPMPDLGVDVPFTVDKALLYALMRRESRFDPSAQSNVGAYGLMQVMPSTAAWLTGDDKLAKKPELLLDPATNLRVGQAYIAYLASQGPVGNDMLRVIAAYNGGPLRVMDPAKQLGPDADVLTFIESIQVPQTRVYVEEVMAAYWAYRRIMGQDTKSLDAVAAGAKRVDMRLDTQGAPQPLATAALINGEK
ncbi:lytic transglycosylase domain-containing protein [Caulobacter sp. 17J80-11]|uniref:lytic transglycosylase domain-containing protein n=1 Tax=Caulobacter sp. 17J80-11 TaxID=2763502 RepID=UPI001653C125|nr:lytic transglycosylase domain-containing protein [Caulobacter sp. 17J80-11]MBC6981805.1 lytic transglycosylase domain-containing protein [Caulobacter sp. 17J80-11]